MNLDLQDQIDAQEAFHKRINIHILRILIGKVSKLSQPCPTKALTLALMVLEFLRTDLSSR